ncbi:MAG TPA: DNA-binding response regulator [Lachnospiraceae bacterium]|nr:DNA-binding response regulator [Lachnospiraceae bacterium]
MYRILIADDEGLSINSMTYMLDEAFGDSCEIRTAQTGRAVIEIAEAFHPDIAVMDIRMPGINGIEAIREIKKISPQTLYLVVTAYDTFDYAREAIDLGVERYLSKPLDKDAFLSAVSEAMKKIDREKERRSSNLKTREKLETVVPMIESGFVLSLLLQDPVMEDINRYRSLLEIQENFGYIILIECGDEVEKGSRELGNPIGSGIRIQKYASYIRDALKSRIPRAVIGQISINQLPVFVPSAEEHQSYAERTKTIESCESLVRALTEYTGVSFRIGIGTVHPIAKEALSYSEAKRSLHFGSGPVSHADDLALSCVYEADYPVDLERELFEKVQAGDEAGAGKAADSFFNWMEDTQLPAEEDSVRLKVLEFVLFAEHTAYAEGSMGEYRFNSRSDYLRFIETADMEQLHLWFVSHITQATRKIAGKGEAHAGSVIDEAKAYICANYQRDLGLEEVSKAVNISPYYFSKLFKEKTGTTFVEYLTRLRIEKAAQMLEDPGNSVRDICYAVGYQDPNYFSRIFKRSTGLTPSEYRQQKQGG